MFIGERERVCVLERDSACVRETKTLCVCVRVCVAGCVLKNGTYFSSVIVFFILLLNVLKMFSSVPTGRNAYIYEKTSTTITRKTQQPICVCVCVCVCGT